VETGSVQAPRCAHCGRDLASHFQINRVEADGTLKSSVAICSFICMAQWAYSQGLMRGMQGAFAAKSAFDKLRALFKGG